MHILEILLIIRECSSHKCNISVNISNIQSQDDLTVMLNELQYVNLQMEAGAKTKAHEISALMENLQCNALRLINSDIKLPKHIDEGKNNRPRTGFIQRLKAKDGRFRKNLSGKRVNFTGRTVISPDPNLRIDEVGVPQDIAKILTFPEHVTEHNIEIMRRRILNGPFTHPGALNLIHKSEPNIRRYLVPKLLPKFAANLRVGDIGEKNIYENLLPEKYLFVYYRLISL